MALTPALLKSSYDAGMALIKQGKLAEATAHFDGLALQAPAVPEVHYQRAKLAAHAGQSAKRLQSIQRALALRTNDPAILDEAIAAEADAGHQDAALALHDKRIALEPKAVKPQAEKALYLQRIGAFDKSEALFRKLLKKNPTDAELYRMLAATIKFQSNDPLIGAMRRLANHPKLSTPGKMHVNFALAKAMEDIKAYPKVFPHLHKANAAQSKLWPDDKTARDTEWNAVVEAQQGLMPTSEMPGTEPRIIFVTGLPRSGTTLVEQIIASHSQVHAGGEMATALRCAYSRFGAGADMKRLADLPVGNLTAFSTALSQANQPNADLSKPYLTDKSIMAFLIYGLLHASLPNARFIVVHRDPRDIAVSIFKNHFTGGTHRYATDLASIADVIKAFRTIVSHWRNVLPDRFTEVKYETLVAAPETVSRKLIDAAGLDWEDQCLDFHKASGTVKTLSLHQVRQPIYASSAQAWRRYESDLQPFFDAWGDTPWD